MAHSTDRCAGRSTECPLVKVHSDLLVNIDASGLGLSLGSDRVIGKDTQVSHYCNIDVYYCNSPTQDMPAILVTTQ